MQVATLKGEGQEIDVELQDGMQVCQFKIRVRASFNYSNISRAVIS